MWVGRDSHRAPLQLLPIEQVQLAKLILTDADDLKSEEVEAISARNRGAIIHTIELTRRRAAAEEGPLARLAHANHGSYRRVCISPPN